MLGGDVPGVVKRMSIDKLLSLSDLARRNGLHATGNTEWVQRRRSGIKYVFAHPLTWKTSQGAPVLRCYIGIVGQAGVSVFTMDIPQKEYDTLEPVTDPWEISEVILNHAHFVQPDDA
jgi:hypothetical protein